MNLTDITKQIRAFADQLEEQSKIGLAMPPDGRPLRNEDELTAEQVGAGFRLTIKEDVFSDAAEVWNSARKEWRKTSTKSFDPVYTYRLPLSVPWPSAPVDPYAELKAAHAAGKVIECITGTDRRWMAMQGEPRWFLPVEDYRIKPDAPPFQLPPPPPGMQWHREDGWKAEDLPPGTRPLCFDEPNDCRTDEYSFGMGDGWDAQLCRQPKPQHSNGYWRTTRPLVFAHEGKSWTYHRPGDPMPCDGERMVDIITQKSIDAKNWYSCPHKGDYWQWDERTKIIGWRYAEPLTREVELGPEDVPPGSVFRHKDWLPGIHRTYIEINTTGVNWAVNSALDWLELKDSHWQINRSLPLTGKWNPDAWEPCHKEAKP